MKANTTMLAGTLALVAVLGTYYAAPAIAQSVKAALIRDVDNPALNPFQTTITSVSGFIAPAHQRLVIEYVGYSEPDTEGPIQIVTTVNGVQVAHSVPHDTSESYNGFRYSGRTVRIYADPGTQVGYNDTSSNGANIRVSISGYLVNVP
jgi:hypothetical protein